jgi:ankyrin repeat protein
MELLLSRGADVNKTCGGDSPLHNAVFALDKRSIEILLTYGADINIKNNDGDTPYDLALGTHDPSIIGLFNCEEIKEPDST